MQIFCTALLFLLAVIFFARYFSKHCCDRVQIHHFVDQHRIRVEQSFLYTFEIINRKLLFLPVIKIVFTLPTSFAVENGNQVVQAEKMDHTTYIYSITTSLLSYQKVKKRIKFIPMKRGCYVLRVQVRLLDFLGIKSTVLIENEETVVLVHPKGDHEIDSFIDSNSFQGNQILPRWILQDPIFYSGIREYDQKDNWKDIDWKASAKSNKLMVKKYDATSDTEICAFLFTEYKDRFFSGYEAFVENAIEMIANLVKEAYRNQIPMGLSTNMVMKNKLSNQCDIKSGSSHSIKLLDFLSCISDYANTSPAKYVETNFRFFKKRNCLFIMFFYSISEDSAAMINHLAKSGFKIKIISLNSCEYILNRSVEFFKLKSWEVNE